jgi:hypothetical protein
MAGREEEIVLLEGASTQVDGPSPARRLIACRRHNRCVADIDRSLALRAALVQLAGVAVLSIILALALPHSFFEDWGWLTGPGAWILCCLITASVLHLQPGPTLLGAALAGLPSLLAVLIGLHWLGALVAVALFALWCGRLKPKVSSTPHLEG